MPRHNETTIEQDIIDHGFGNVLGVGKGVIHLYGKESRYMHDPDEEAWGDVGTIDGLVGRLDVGIMGEADFADVIRQGDGATGDILDTLRRCSTMGAAEVILQNGTDAQKDYIRQRLADYADKTEHGITTVRKTYYGEETETHPAEADDIRKGLWRDTVYASMIGTPEMGAYTLAKHWVTDALKAKDMPDSELKRRYDMPTLRGYHSGMFPPRSGWSDGRDPSPGEVGQVFPELAKSYSQVEARLRRKYPEIDDEELEHKTVLELARLVAKSTEYNDPNRSPGSPYRSTFAESMAWACLGDQAQRQLRGMRRKIHDVDLHNIGRFIGKSGDNPYEDKWRNIEDYADAVNGGGGANEAREYFASLAKQQIEDMHSILGNDAAEHIIRDGSQKFADIESLSDEEVLERFNQEHETLKRKRTAKMSLLSKAVELRFAEQNHNKNEDGEVPYEICTIDWINNAPFGLINRVHRMLDRGVSQETAFAYALAEYHFPDEMMSHELVDACKGLKQTSLNKMTALNDTQLSITDKLKLADVSRYDSAYDVLALLNQGYSVEDITGNQWLLSLDLRKPIDYPVAAHESQQQKWLAEHSYTYMSGGWSKSAIGKLIKTRLDAGIEASVHDASQWLSTFNLPEHAYDMQKVAALQGNGGLEGLDQELLYDICLRKQPL